jgi:Fur family ferric uptake transcriptional regulator
MLEDTTLRMTKQRQIILDELRAVTSHPTAEDMYDMVRRRLPKVSLGTVYRNLEVLAESGLAQKIDVGGTKKRFDGNVYAHHHVRCTACGRVEDVHLSTDGDLDEIATVMTGYALLRHRLEFIGICPPCQDKRNEH